MKTRLVRIDSKNPEISLIREAAQILHQGGLVAFPTETVYGLAANAFDIQAVRRIFEVKKRPLSKPLAICISSGGYLKMLVDDVSLAAKKLMEKFWPGPLTLVFKRNAGVPDLVVAGGSTVAIRFPKNKIGQLLIEVAGFPLAATSANLSSKRSPTTANQVLADLQGQIDFIIDGGPCDLGIESTVLDVTVSPPTIRRQGAVSPKELDRFLRMVS